MEFLLLLIHLISFKYEKNIKSCFSKYFVQQIKLGQGGKSFHVQKGKILHD